MFVYIGAGGSRSCIECCAVIQESAPAGVGPQRVSRDMETETEEELLQLELGSGSSARSSPSAPGSDLSASTDNIEELHQDAPFAGQAAELSSLRHVVALQGVVLRTLAEVLFCMCMGLS